MSPGQFDIAVIGMGCRFPDADSGEEFFANLVSGRDSIREIPERRWRHAGLYGAKVDGNAISSKWGGFISGVDEFDPRFFKILPSEAEGIDPQQKLFLKCSWEAMEDAGYSRRKLSGGKPIGVFAGVTWNEFSLLANEYGYLQDQYRGPGCLSWGIPNRVSYFFDFTGPSIAIDTACSSSLVALHLAAASLLSGECEMALAGGVNLNLHPAKYIFLSQSNFLSSEGKCRGFGEGGNGYVPSEGVAVVVLKRLKDAEAAGDRIYGVIKATAVNHGGKATGYTVPNPRAHKDVIRTALTRAGVNPRDISYVECHGTGTDLGDPIEIAGLKSAFAEATGERQFCGIGTVKSNIGHCEATAGIAGLIKILYGMREGCIPATLHAETPNRKIDFAKSPFYLITSNQPWTSEEGRLLAGLSSFGAGGANSHCIIQSYPEERRGSEGKTESSFPMLVPISARNPDRTRAYCKALISYLETRKCSLRDVAHTLRLREEFDHRVAFVADSIDTLLEGLGYFVKADPAAGQVFDLRGWKDTDGGIRKALRASAEVWAAREGSFDVWPGVEGKLLSLPGYRFEALRSWISESGALYRKPRFQRPLHPLVDVNASMAAHGCYTKVLDRGEYFVDEHYVQGNPVLPGVCHLEMMDYAAGTYLNSDSKILSDIWFLEPMTFRGMDEMAIRMELAATPDGHRYDILTGDGRVRHSTGKVKVVPKSQEAAVLDIQGMLSRCPEMVDANAFYRLFADKGIVQKGRFQVVTNFQFNETEAIASLALSRLFQGSEAYGFNPTLLDGAVQAAMIHFYKQAPGVGTVLPFQIGSYRRTGTTPANGFAVARLKSAQARKYDLFITDDKGKVLVEFLDFVLKEYKPGRVEIRPLIFSLAVREVAAVRVPNGLPSGLPVCMLGGSIPEQPGDGRGINWSVVPWDSGQPLPENALSQWIREDRGRLPQVCMPIAIGTGLTGNALYFRIADQANRIFQVAQFLGRLNEPVEFLAYLESPEGASDPMATAVAALFRTLNLEYHKIRFRLVEVVRGRDRDLGAEAFLSEVRSENAYVHIVLKGGRRWAPGVQAFEPPSGTQPAGRVSGSWLVTGGGGGLGFKAAMHLLEGGSTVVLVGRSFLADEKRAMLARFPAGRWEYVRCDLTSAEETGSLVTGACSRYSGVWNVIHCAGSLADASFQGKDWVDFERVVGAKVASLIHLGKAMSGMRLDRLILFSSLTSVLGNRGQSDYSFANGYLDGFASVAGTLFGGNPRTCAINWPYWEEGGMRIGEERLASYAEAFLSLPLPTEVGFACMDMVSGSLPQAGVIYSGASLPELDAKLALKPLPAVREPKSAEGALRESGEGHRPASEPEKKAVIRDYLVGFLEQELKLTLSHEDLETHLSELGVDSIAQMDLIAKLEKGNRFPEIPQSLLEEHGSVLQLVEFFLQNHHDADYSQVRT